MPQPIDENEPSQEEKLPKHDRKTKTMGSPVNQPDATAQLQTKIQNLETALKEAEEKCGHTQHESQQLQEAIAAQEETIRNLQMAKEGLEKSLEQIVNQPEGSELQSQLAKMSQDLETIRSDKMDLERAAKSAQQRVQELEQKAQNLQEELESRTQKLSSQLENADRSLTEKQSLLASQAQEMKKLGSLETANKDLEARLKAKGDEAAKKIQELQQELEKVQQAAASAPAGADEAAKKRVAELEQDVNNLNSATAKLRADLDQANQKANQLDQAKRGVETKLASKDQEFAGELMRLNARHQSELQALNDEPANPSMIKEANRQRHGKRMAVAVSIVLGILASVLLILWVKTWGKHEEPKAKLSSSTSVAASALEAPALETMEVAMNSRNLQLYFGDTDPGCVPGKIPDERPGKLGIACDGKQTYNRAKDCTDVSKCAISLPKKFSAGGEFPVTAENLAAISSQSDPACYRHDTGTPKAWPMDSMRIAHCDHVEYDGTRDCYNYSAESCRIVIPAPTR